MKRMTMSASPKDRIHTFLSAFRAVSNNTEPELHIGHLDTGSPAIIISLDGKDYGFTAKEARTFASLCEEAMNAYPNDPDRAKLADLIMMLRAGADKSELTLFGQ